MSKELLYTSTLIVTSYCGPALPDSHTRMRLQIDALPNASITISYPDAVELRRVIDAWIRDYKP